MKLPFTDVPVGTSFIHNGNICVKVTSRTALMVQYMRKFYFTSKDIVEVA
jgi:hypothetical protein